GHGDALPVLRDVGEHHRVRSGTLDRLRGADVVLGLRALPGVGADDEEVRVTDLRGRVPDVGRVLVQGEDLVDLAFEPRLGAPADPGAEEHEHRDDEDGGLRREYGASVPSGALGVVPRLRPILVRCGLIRVGSGGACVIRFGGAQAVRAVRPVAVRIGFVGFGFFGFEPDQLGVVRRGAGHVVRPGAVRVHVVRCGIGFGTGFGAAEPGDPFETYETASFGLTVVVRVCVVTPGVVAPVRL